MTAEQQAVIKEGLKQLIPGFETAQDKLQFITALIRKLMTMMKELLISKPLSNTQ